MRCFALIGLNLKGDYETLHVGSNLTECKKAWKDLRVNRKNDFQAIWYFPQYGGRCISKAGFIMADEAKKAPVKKAPEKKAPAKKKEDK